MPSRRTAILACLLWKEWREIRWKLAALLAIVLALFAWSVTDSDRNGSDSYSMAFSFSFLLVLPLGSAFIAMNLAAGEASRGTLPMFRSQPVRQEWVAAIKLVLGIVTVWLTQVVTVLCVLGLVDQGGMSSRVAREIYSNFPALVETGHWSGDLLVTSALLIASFVLWIAAPGVNSESEVRSGAIGLGLIAFVWSGVVAFYYFTDIFDSPIVRAAHAALPGGVVLAPLGHDPEQAITTFALAAYLSTHAPLAWWYVTRYGKTERVSGQSPTPVRTESAITRRPGKPFATPLLALLWKQVRQATPIIATGLACALLVEASVLVGMWQAEEYDSVDRQAAFLQDFSGQAIGMFTFFGCLAGLVTGVGQSTTDLGSSLAQFWRSRPIHIDLWFAVMLGAGLVMLVIAFGAPVTLGLWVLSSYPVDWVPAAGMLAFSMLLLSYSAGLFSGCVIRQASYASLIGIAIVGLSYAALVKCFNWLSVSSEPDGYFGGAMALISAGMVLLAWLSVRKDWALSR